ncbi:MAG: siderophore ABC transporter substrate-binding protein [Mesorhizobium sp.]
MLRAFLAVGFALLASGLSAHAVEIQTAKGLVSIESVPARIAVFDVAALDTLDSLGVKAEGVPGKLYVPELVHLSDGAQPIGTLFEPDLEALSALAPDLIIVGARAASQFDSVSRVAKTIDMTIGDAEMLDEAKKRLITYGELFGKQDAAAREVASFEAAIAAARKAIEGKGNALILMTNGPKVSAFGDGSRFGWLHRALGLPPAVADVEAATHGEAISFEFVSKANPDWLIVLDRASAVGLTEQNAATTLDNELVAQTTAWKKGQVIYLPPADFYIAAGGIQSTTRVLKAITDAFSAVK